MCTIVHGLLYSECPSGTNALDMYVGNEIVYCTCTAGDKLLLLIQTLVTHVFHQVRV